MNTRLVRTIGRAVGLSTLGAAALVVAGCGSEPATGQPALPAEAQVGDELVARIDATAVSGSWANADAFGAIVTLTAGSNQPRHAILPGGFSQSTSVSLGAWDGGELAWSMEGEADVAIAIEVDPSAAGLPVLTLLGSSAADDTPLLAYRDGDSLQYILTNENGGTGILPTLLLAQWGRPHDIEGLFDVASLTYQGDGHETLPFDGPFEGSHPLLRMATSNGLVAPAELDSAVPYRVSPVPVAFAPGPGEPREVMLDSFPWLTAAGWLELEREGKATASGTPLDDRAALVENYVQLDYRVEGSARVSFEAEAGGEWWSSLGLYADATGVADARSSGTGRTVIELPAGTTSADVTGLRLVVHEGSGSLERLRTFAIDPATFEVVPRGTLATSIPLSEAVIELPGL
jgi:hypothetical protein